MESLKAKSPKYLKFLIPVKKTTNSYLDKGILNNVSLDRKKEEEELIFDYSLSDIWISQVSISIQMLLIKFTEQIWMKPNGTMDSGPIGKYIQRAMAFLLELNGELSVWNCCTIVWIEQQWNHACARPYHRSRCSLCPSWHGSKA